MITSFHYTYLVGDAIFFAVWLVLFLHRKDLRRKIVSMSVIGGVAGPISEFMYLRDYWNPQLIGGFSMGLEDIIFGFAIAGIAAVIYEEVFGKRFARRHVRNHRRWMIGVPISFVVWLLLSICGFGINSIYASIIGFIALGIAVLVSRHDLMSSAFMSGMLTGALMLVGYVILTHLFPGFIQAWWRLDNISGIIIWGAPLEELVWGFSWGFLAGPIYEFVNGIRLKN
jgi:hypothetical protein